MQFFKVLMVVNTIVQQLTKAMEDNFLTAQEIINLVDTVLKEELGKGLDEVGLKISKVNVNGKTKTKIEFIV
jgi:hypothetical protein